MRRVICLFLMILGLTFENEVIGQLFVPNESVSRSTNSFVGIDVQSPSAKLEIGSKDDGSNEELLRLTGAKSDSKNYNLRIEKKFSEGNASGWYPIFDWQFNMSQYLGYNGNIMTFNHDGHIGVNSINPSAKLEIGSKDDGSNEELLRFVGAKGDSKNYNLRIEKKFTEGNAGGWYPIFDWQFNMSQYLGYNGNVMTFYRNGNVGIGTDLPKYKLDVNGTIHAREVKVDLDFPADYVFKSDYKLLTLEEVEQFIESNSHLPEIPSASEIKENGLNIGDMQNKLLQKIEEMTLYMIEQNKKIEELEKQNAKIKALEEKIAKLETALK